ncbi:MULTISPECIES: response regulator [Kocuria]|uniref:Response regulator transcription factor n=1 Tax=Kocuria subflava TaxID=1736139 RepID=A0A846TQD3_9MICC|nr:response regulator transcription factor [Kocuria sp. CPCC 104605]NKE09120.1 response regulator transcription factor [Kocuria subflava]
MISVLLVDDHALIRSGFSMVLSSAPDIRVAGEAANGRQAVDWMAEHHADVVLMDVQMPVMDGIEATRNIVAAGGSKVIILTTFDREDYLFAALGAGASGFLLKNADPDDLIDAVRAVAGGHALLAPEVTLAVIRHLNGTADLRGEDQGAATDQPAAGSRSASQHAVQAQGGVPSTIPDDSALASLTQREHQVLQLMAQGMSNAEIAQDLYLGAATIKTHVSNILAKTGSRDRVQAVVFAYRTGLHLT